MEDQFIINSVTVVFAALGWVVAHWFTSNRDMKNKRREIRTNYLISVYRKIDSSVDPEEYSRKWCESLQGAVAEIQLFGSEEQIKLAHQFSELILSERIIDQKTLKELMYDLRSSLRRELGLIDVNSNIGHIRITEVSKQ